MWQLPAQSVYVSTGCPSILCNGIFPWQLEQDEVDRGHRLLEHQEWVSIFSAESKSDFDCQFGLFFYPICSLQGVTASVIDHNIVVAQVEVLSSEDYLHIDRWRVELIPDREYQKQRCKYVKSLLLRNLIYLPSCSFDPYLLVDT